MVFYGNKNPRSYPAYITDVKQKATRDSQPNKLCTRPRAFNPSTLTVNYELSRCRGC